jgi:hypothetical protein
MLQRREDVLRKKEEISGKIEVGCCSCCPESKVVEEKNERPYRGVLPTAGCQRPAYSSVPPTRGSCFMGTAWLTRHEKIAWDDQDE